VATAGAKKKKPKRQALPGGAPLKAAPRGRSRKKAAPRSKVPKPKPACKYGPRDADGYCPKKPKSARSTRANPTRVTSKTTEGATEQAIKVLTNPRATTDQKTAAVSQVGTTILTDAARKTARKNAPKIIQAIKDVAPAVGIVAGTAVTLKVGGIALSANRRREADRFAEQEIQKTKKRLKQPLSPKDEVTLRQQYFDWFVRQPVTNPFLGK
jgi:hypothetical protein